MKSEKLTFIHNFSAIILIKYFFSFVIPLFHHVEIIVLSVSVLGVVELWVEYRWNYMKFHLYSTPNSTLDKPLIIRVVTMRRWNGGITNDKKYFSGKRWEKVLTAVKNNTKQGWGLLVVGYWLHCTILPTTHN